MEKENRKPSGFICHKCGKDCGNAGLLAMHMKSPARSYRFDHRKYDRLKGGQDLK